MAKFRGQDVSIVTKFCPGSPFRCVIDRPRLRLFRPEHKNTEYPLIGFVELSTFGIWVQFGSSQARYSACCNGDPVLSNRGMHGKDEVRLTAELCVMNAIK